MKRKFTFNIFAGGKKTTFLTLAAVLFVTSVLFIGCYKFRSINQPTEGYTDSYFDVPIVVQRDDDPSLDDGMWASAGADIGLFGVMVPDGWTVDDNIPYSIVSKDPSKSNTGILIYDAAHSKTLQDTLPAPAGYHWWGAITDRMADMTSFDSLFFTPRIKTDGQTGSFYLRYAVGDKNYWDRNPADQYNFGGGLSDPIEIKISSNVGLNALLSKANVSLYPNPTHGMLNVNLNGYKSEVVKMNIRDTKGSVVMSKEIVKSTNVYDLNSFPKGVYFVELKSGNNISSSKIVIK
jgi:hypothetical protein